MVEYNPNLVKTKIGDTIYTKSTEENPIMKARMRRALKLVDKVEPRKPKTSMMYPVTDLNYYMDGYLRDNLNEIPKFLKKAWDCVAIYSGSGKVRIGKSTKAMQDAYYVAWLLNQIAIRHGLTKKNNLVPFNNDNVAFNPDELMKTAEKLPRHSVIVYDEGRAGLDSARAMENINKAMQDFFQECGQFGHVIFIVLPDFFKLQETIAIPRSLFLVNVYADKNYNRGYFEFFNEKKKELLYLIGKKRWGTTAKYLSVEPDFRGRFTDFFPINKDIYEQKKRDAIKKRKKTRLEVRWRLERDYSWYSMRKLLGLDAQDIATELKKYPDVKLTQDTVARALVNVRKRLEVEGYDIDEEEKAGKSD